MSPISVEVDCSHLPPVVDVLSPPCKSCSICRKANRRSFPVICPTGDEKTAIGTSVGFHLPRRTRPSHVCSAARNARNASGNLAQALRLGLRPEGPWELSPGFSLGRLHPPRQPCRGVRPRRNGSRRSFRNTCETDCRMPGSQIILRLQIMLFICPSHLLAFFST
jgi:hypothetical protein